MPAAGNYSFTGPKQVTRVGAVPLAGLEPRGFFLVSEHKGL